MPKQEWPLEMGREAALAATQRVAGNHAELIAELEARATACETVMALMGPGSKDAGTPLPDLLRQAATALATPER